MAPTGSLALSGQLVLRTDYPELTQFALNSGNIAASDGAWTKGQFSPGDGSTTIRLPDPRGEFIRAWANGGAVDSGRAIGSNQAADIAPHSHPLPIGGAMTGAGAGANAWQGSGGAVLNTSNSTGTETRPRNIAWLWCISV